MVSRRLFWGEIKALHQGEWVELIDVDWDWDKPFPKRATVLHHSTDRGELLFLSRQANISSETIVIYVGAINPQSTFNSSSHIVG